MRNVTKILKNMDPVVVLILVGRWRVGGLFFTSQVANSVHAIFKTVGDGGAVHP